MDNTERWKKFLSPMVGRHVQRTTIKYEKNKIDSVSCLSREFAIQLIQKVEVEEDEFEAVQHVRKRSEANRNLFQETTPKEATGANDVIVMGENDDSESEKDTQVINSDDKVNTPFRHDFNSPESLKHGLDSEDEEDARKKPKVEPKILPKSASKDVIEGNQEPTENSKEILTNMRQGTLTAPSPSSKHLTMSVTKLPTGYTGSMLSLTPKDRPMMQPTRSVDDRSTSLSKWTFEMFVKYFDFQNCVTELNINSEIKQEVGLTGQLTSNLLDNVKGVYKNVLSVFETKSLKNCMQKESYARVLLDGILMELCKVHDTRLYTEEQINFTYLPTATIDYLVTTKDGRPLGCVEAKSPATMNRKAFVQAVLELVLVQQLAHKKGVNVEDTPLFCILSDGYRFVIMQIKGHSLLLEHATTSDSAKLKIQNLDADEDFHRLVTMISNVMQESNTIAVLTSPH